MQLSMILLVTLAFNFAGASLFPIPKSRCSPGWTEFKGSCYGFSEVTSTWPDAVAVCLGHKAFLVEIDSEEENAFLVNRTKPSEYGSFWIGGTHILNGGLSVWSYRGKNFTFTDWNPGQPSSPSSEHCVEIRASHDYRWNDVQCFVQNKFVCEASIRRCGLCDDHK